MIIVSRQLRREALSFTRALEYEPESKLLQVKELEDALQIKDAMIQSLEQQASPEVPLLPCWCSLQLP